MSNLDPEQLAKDNSLVMHVPTGIVGRVLRYHDGKIDKYRAAPTRVDGDMLPVGQEGDREGGEVAAPVLVVEPGHGFLYRPGNFELLTIGEANYYAAVEETIRGVLKELAALGATMGVAGMKGLVLYRAALDAQLRALR